MNNCIKYNLSNVFYKYTILKELFEETNHRIAQKFPHFHVPCSINDNTYIYYHNFMINSKQSIFINLKKNFALGKREYLLNTYDDM